VSRDCVKKLAICLCFRNASAYLDEWLAYYRAVGADYFYLYDNNSTDDYSEALWPYLKQGLAELHCWPGAAQQQRIYEDCLRRARRKVRWLAFLDDDEFLWPVLDRDLPAALSHYEPYAGVAVCWYLYGSSHHLTRPKGLVVENFIWRARMPDSHVKCVVQPTRVIRPLVIGHSFQCEAGCAIVDEHLRTVTSSQALEPSGNLLRVNHYATKSLQELRLRRTQPQADTGKVTEHPLSTWEQWAEGWNQTRDVGIHRFVPKLREVREQMSAFQQNRPLGAYLLGRLRGVFGEKAGRTGGL